MSQEKVRVHVDQLQPGMYISLSEHWLNHPFMLNNFKLKKEKQIEIIKEMGIEEVLYIPEKSERSPLSLKSKKRKDGKQAEDKKEAQDKLFADKRQKIEQLKNIKEKVNKCRGKYQDTMKKMPNLMSDLFAGKKEGVEAAELVVGEMVDTFLAESESVVHLMSMEGDEADLAYHFINVSVLSLMIGESMDLSKQDMHCLGKGALLHDIGKLRIEKKYLRKARESMNRHELDLVRKHPEYGVEILKKSDPEIPTRVLDIVRQHHEYLEGLGYPRGLSDTDISLLSRIVTVANVYDNLTNHYDPQKSLTPHQALLKMFKEYGDLLDMHVLSVMVHRLGVYPPGSIIELANGTLGKVMGINPDRPLKPYLFLFDPGVPKKEAAIFNLADEPDLTIRKSISPSELSQEANRYLSPRLKLAYYADTLDEGAA